MLTAERRRLLVDEVTRTGRVITSDVASRLGVSEVTIRADLDLLERDGRVTRTHGGATVRETSAAVIGFDARTALRRDAKRRIALVARQFVESNQTVVFDAGTTVMNLAQVMPPVENLTVYTPGITIAQHLLTTEGVEVRLLGGRLDEQRLETVGTPREQGIEHLVAHTLFLGVNGIDSDLDIVDQSAALGLSKMEYIRHSRRIIVLADASKWHTAGATKIASLASVDIVISDEDLEPELRKQIAALGTEVLIA